MNYQLVGNTIDYLINNQILSLPNYIKIDVDGIEHLILDGGKDCLINENVKSISVELNENFKDQFEAVMSIMKKCNFHISSKKHLGSFSLTGISTNMPKIGKLLGDKNYRGKGLGYKSTKLLLFFAFNYLKFNNLYAKTRKDNTSNINLNKKLGFQIVKEEEINGKQFIIMKLENFTEI